MAGVDIGYRKDTACAAVVVMSLTDLKILEEALAAKPVQFPYVPGLLSFREGPVILEALGKLKTAPDILMVDGQGIAPAGDPVDGHDCWKILSTPKRADIVQKTKTPLCT